MISNKTLFHITQALPNCSVGQSSGEMIIIDSNAEVVGKLDFKEPGVTVYQDYTHSKKVAGRLKKAGITVNLKELDMNEITRILYDN